VLLVFAWLVPNHYYPWSSFWSEALTAFAFALLLIPAVARAASPVRLPLISVAAAGLALVPLIQWQVGLIHFGGDARMAGLYVLGVGLAALLWVAVEIEKWLRRRGSMQRTATGG
jgi:hypothetical protein